MYKEKRKDSSQQGSVVIEAVICLTIFITAIFTILSFINLCRAQAMISTAVDATAKEMAQYAYFYHLSGLDAVEKTIEDSTADDRKKFNDIVGGTEAIYSIFQEAKKADISELKASDIKDVADAALSGDKAAAVTELAEAVKVDKANLSEKMNQVTKAVGSIEDPIGFLKSMATIAGMAGASMLKSQLIAAPLARVLIEKHFEVDGMNADTYLRSFRIDGMDALNFKMSTIFAPTSPDDIHLVVYYKMKAINFMNFEFGDLTLCKEAVTRAWLGGDKEITTKKAAESGIWDMASLKYGKYIVQKETEDYIAKGCKETATAGTDAYDESSNTWIHIRSMDIYSDSYLEDASKIKNELRKEYSTISSAAGTSSETIKIKGNDGTKEVASAVAGRKTKLVVVVPEGTETEAFKKAVEEFKSEMNDTSFTIEIKHAYGKSPKDPSSQKESKEE